MKIAFGWRRDQPDHRDYTATLKLAGPLPPFVDLEGRCPPVYDQGALGSCTANAAGAAAQFTEMDEHKRGSIPSRLFIYWNTRRIEGSTKEDSGATIRDTFKALASAGYCRETVWPYKVKDFAKRPAQKAYDEAKPHAIKAYARLPQTETAIKDALAHGDPVVFGFTVYDSFEPDANGVIPMPRRSESVQGGHAIMLVGYDDKKRLFKFRNSWGKGWGKNGYAYMSYAYVLNSKLAADFWVLREVP